MAQMTIAARMPNVIQVPTATMLQDTVARRIRRGSVARHCAATLSALLAAGGLLAPAAASAGWVGDAMDLMGTRVSVELWHDDDARGRELVAMVMEEYRRIDREMSTY